ncbi:hypothetical protein B566_EDAN006423 [Ephemera danica]|nr:hypothetical protein B566_EDAN006423 [Ephemera danica]
MILLVPACLGIPLPDGRRLATKDIQGQELASMFENQQDSAQPTSQSIPAETQSTIIDTETPVAASTTEIEPVTSPLLSQEDNAAVVTSTEVHEKTTSQDVQTSETSSTSLKVADDSTQVTDSSAKVAPLPPNPPPVYQVSVSVSSSVSEATPRPDIFTTFLNAFAESAPVSTGSPVPAAASRSQLSVEEPMPATEPLRQYGARIQFSNRYRPRAFTRSRPRHYSTSQSASEPVAVRLAPSSAFAAARLARLRSPTFSDLQPKQPEPRSINYQIADHGYGQNQKIYQQPAKIYAQPEKIYAEPEKVYGEPEKVYGEPEKMYGEPEKVYGEPEKVYGQPEKVYGEPEKVYGEPEKVYNQPEQNYGKSYAQPEQTYGQPEQNYEVPESVSVQTNGRAHGVQPSATAPPQQAEGLQVFDTALEAERVAASKKFGYVVEGRNYRKYRVEERTPDGFIVGEYGVVSHDDGQLRGVRYTADSTINPKLIYDALMKFLAL